MKESEIKKVLQQVNNYRKKGKTDLAIEKLSILNQEYPQNTEYLVLIAKTFIEARQINKAIEYCNKALLIDSLCPEAYIELGYIEERQHNVSKAEEYYKKSLEKNNIFRKGHQALLPIFFEQGEYEKTIVEAEFLLNNFDIDRNNYSIEDKQDLGLNWLSGAYFYLTNSLIKIKDYNKAIYHFNDLLDLFKTYILKYPSSFSFAYKSLYKLYTVTNNLKKIKETEQILINQYKIPISNIQQLKEEAMQGNFEVK